MTVRDVERFDRRATGYEREWLQPRLFAPVHRATLDVAGALVAMPSAVLDVGCGTGALLRDAGERFRAARLVGIDPSARMIAMADAGGAELVQAAAEHLPFPDRTFDLVVSTLSLHHWRDRAAAVREIARVLRPGGAIVLADRWLARGVERDLADAGLLDIGRRPIFRLGPVTIVAAACARRGFSEL